MSAIVTRPPKLHIDDELIIGNDTGPKVETARIGLSGGFKYVARRVLRAKIIFCDGTSVWIKQPEMPDAAPL